MHLFIIYLLYNGHCPLFYGWVRAFYEISRLVCLLACFSSWEQGGDISPFSVTVFYLVISPFRFLLFCSVLFWLSFIYYIRTVVSPPHFLPVPSPPFPSPQDPLLYFPLEKFRPPRVINWMWHIKLQYDLAQPHILILLFLKTVSFVYYPRK